MSAAAAAKPRPTKTVTAAAKPETFERRRDGFTKLDHAKVMYELPRLTGGKTQLLCVMYVLSETVSANRDSKAPPLEKSRAISSAEFAWFAHETNVRTVEMALKDLCDRKVLAREYAGRRGLYTYSVPVDTWAKLDDYAEKKPVASAEALDSGEETANVQRRNFRSVRVSAGVPTKPLPLESPPQRVQFECSGAASIQHGIEEGLLIVRVKVVELSKRKAKPNGADLAALSNGVSNDTNGHALPSSYDVHFRVAWAEAGLSGSDWDHEQAKEFWKDLEIVDQMKAVEGVRKRKAAGEFDDPQYHFLPQNYFKKGVWQRAVRERKKNAIQEIFDRI